MVLSIFTFIYLVLDVHNMLKVEINKIYFVRQYSTSVICLCLCSDLHLAHDAK